MAQTNMQRSNQPSTIAQAEAKISKLIGPEMEAKAIRALDECLSATAWVRATDPDGGRTYREVPDHSLRLMAAVRTLEFSRGKPASTLNVNSPGGNADRVAPLNLRDVIAKNPLLMAEIGRMYLNAANEEIRKREIPVASEPVSGHLKSPPPPRGGLGQSLRDDQLRELGKELTTDCSDAASTSLPRY